ncbi:dihydropteroate synthase [Spongisporangium articulatum]|uniref:Dihydropteroate synthase n=1 Tax=Spongisporangium articulatum TaxID=3362603 RepID=A0ABW8ASE6_9ACTN
MAVLNRTTDSFYAPARLLDDGAADAAVARAVEEGADILDVGGVRAGPGAEVSVEEEIARVVPVIERVRSAHPGLVISVDTWRGAVAREACRAGAALVNDTWAGHDPTLVEVAAEHGAGVVCSHTGGAQPRTLPRRVAYGTTTDGVVDAVLASLLAAARHAEGCGVPKESILIDPTIDFGKNTWHGLALLRRLEMFTGFGYPVLMALSRKDLIGESLGLDVDQRLEGTLAATAVSAWQGVRVFRVHDVRATRRVLDLVSMIRGELPPRAPLRGLT